MGFLILIVGLIVLACSLTAFYMWYLGKEDKKKLVRRNERRRQELLAWPEMQRSSSSRLRSSMVLDVADPIADLADQLVLNELILSRSESVSLGGEVLCETVGGESNCGSCDSSCGGGGD